MRNFMTLTTVAALVLSTAPANADLGDQLAKLLPGDGAIGDQFGSTVAISGTTAVVGSRYDDDNGSESGSAYIFSYNGTNWVQTAKLLADDGTADDNFGWSVAISGDLAIIGARGDNFGSGSAYIFRNDGSTWNQEAKLLPTTPAVNDWYGGAVAIDGEVAVVGANSDDDYAIDAGSAYVYRYNGNNWIMESRLYANDASTGDRFGVDVSIDGDVVVIGAYGDSDLGPWSGSAYVFRYDNMTWAQEDKLLADDGSQYDEFGRTTAVYGDVAVISGYRHDHMGVATGSAYVYRFNGTDWDQEVELLASDGAVDDMFGIAVSVFGNLAVIGAFHDDDHGSLSGSAYIFWFDGTDWSELQKITADDAGAGDRFGVSVAITGRIGVIGAFMDTDNGSESGSAYLFDVDVIPCPADLTGDDVVNIDDIFAVLGLWGDCPDPCPPYCDGDLTEDCAVNIDDIFAILGQWGPCE